MVELLVSADGRGPSVIVRKHIENPALLAHEVRWLTRAQGPGVVRLHAVDPGAGHYSTCAVGPLTLAGAATGPFRTYPLLVGVWTTLERLHRLGLIHGSVAADHVVVGRRGPVLLSPAGPEPADRDADIVGFGRMVTDLAGVWTAAATVSGSVLNRWVGVGRAIATLSESAASLETDRLVSGAEIRRLLAELDPLDHGARRWVGRRLRRRRPGGSDRGRRAGRQPSRS